MFVNIKDVGETYFSSCENCQNDCCSAPLVSLAPLILEDIEYAYKNFLIQFAYINNELRLLMVINRGEGSCKYFIDRRCSIYEERPPACRMFPISPYFDQFFISSDCSALSSNKDSGELICDEENISPNFYHPRVENFIEKLDRTREFLNKVENDLEPTITVAGVKLYKYVGDLDDDYIKMHKESLIHL